MLTIGTTGTEKCTQDMKRKSRTTLAGAAAVMYHHYLEEGDFGRGSKFDIVFYPSFIILLIGYRFSKRIQEIYF